MQRCDLLFLLPLSRNPHLLHLNQGFGMSPKLIYIVSLCFPFELMQIYHVSVDCLVLSAYVIRLLPALFLILGYLCNLLILHKFIGFFVFVGFNLVSTILLLFKGALVSSVILL